MIHFHQLQVKKIVRETEDCVLITFSVPPELADAFRFRQGQSLTIRKWLKGEELRRNYSICSSPLENTLQVAVKKVSGGLFSTYANDELKEGDFLEVMPPVGKFHTELNPAHRKSYVAIAAGSGITPILSIIKTTMATEPGSSFTVVYGNRNRSSIIFKEALEALKDKYINRFRVYHVLSREKTEAEINHGRIDAGKCDQLFRTLINLSATDEVFLCGPEEMIFCVRDYLLQNAFPKPHIHFELFTIPGQKKSAYTHQKRINDDTGPSARVSVQLDGILFDFDLGFGSASILDAALAEGADLPYACKGGVCCTCKARLVEGQVSMDVNWGLEQEEIDRGFILTCQSHPKTEKVVVDFDVK